MVIVNDRRISMLGVSLGAFLTVGAIGAGATNMPELPPVDDAWNFQDPTASEASFRDLVDKGRTANEAAYVVEAMTQLARSIGQQRRFDEAHSVLNDAESLLTNDMPRERVRFLLERGRVTNSSGSPGSSIQFFEKALSLAEENDFEYFAVDAAHMLGIVEEPEEAIRWNERAIGMAEAAESDRARHWLGPLYNNLAWTYNDLGRHRDALALFEKDVAFRESMGRSFEASIALWSKAKTLRFLGRIEEALEIQVSLVDHPERKGKPAEGYTYEEIGECLLLLGRKAEAAPQFAIAFARLGGDSWLKANEPERLARIERLSHRE